MRGRTNVGGGGSAIINGEVISCEVATGETIEQGDFVETSYRGKTGYLPTPAHDYYNSYVLSRKTNNYITKVPGDNNLFIYRAKQAIKGEAVIVILYEYTNYEFIEKCRIDCGFVSNKSETDLFFINDNHFVLQGYMSNQGNSLALFKLNDDKTAFDLVQNFVAFYYSSNKGKIFVRGGNIIFFNSRDTANLYIYTFNGETIDETPTLIPVTYMENNTEREEAYPYIGYGYYNSSNEIAHIAKLSDNVYAYTSGYNFYSSSKYYPTTEVNVLTIAEDGLSASVNTIDYRGYSGQSSSTLPSSSYSPAIARLTDEYFIVNNGSPGYTATDTVAVYHITDGKVLLQDVNNSNKPLRNLIEVKEGVVFGFSDYYSVVKLIFDPNTKALTFGWNNAGNDAWGSSDINDKRSLCLFDDNILFIVALKNSDVGDADDAGIYAFYTFGEDYGLSYGFDGSDDLPNLARSYSGGKAIGFAKVGGTEGEIISVIVPPET